MAIRSSVCYEVDLELTSMLEGHVPLLAKAALATGRQLPCRVAEPKCRRERRSGHKPNESLALGDRRQGNVLAQGARGFADRAAEHH